MQRSRATVGRTLPAVVVHGDRGALVWLSFTYRSRDPFAVEVSVPTGGGESSTWVFARELLAAGVVESAGEGDVRISPWVATEPGRDTVRLALRSPSVDLLVQLDAADLDEFVAASWSVVLPGNESAHLDLDAAWRRLVA